MEVLAAALLLYLAVDRLLVWVITNPANANLLRVLRIVWLIIAIIWLLIFGHIPPVVVRIGG